MLQSRPGAGVEPSSDHLQAGLRPNFSERVSAKIFNSSKTGCPQTMLQRLPGKDLGPGGHGQGVHGGHRHHLDHRRESDRKDQAYQIGPGVAEPPERPKDPGRAELGRVQLEGSKVVARLEELDGSWNSRPVC